MNLELNKQLYIDTVYPVGSIYMSINSTSPATLFGGTWERITGGFIYGCVSSYGTGNGTGTSTGASTGNTGSTTLTVDQIPSHTHTITTARQYGSGTATDGTPQKLGRSQPNADGLTYTFETNGKGGSKGHTHSLNNHTHTIPYIAVFIWKRTA